MSNSYIWLVIFGLLVMVLGMRWTFLVVPRRFQPKGALAQALNFAPLAALVAICVPEVMKFQIESMSNTPVKLIDNIKQDWRLWGGLTMLTITLVFRSSKSSALYGLIASALVIFFIK
jgi:branched-subunit amino acid transport protein